MTSTLKADRLYLGDNGRMFCGRLEHAGASAFYTWKDRSGEIILDATGMKRVLAEKIGREPECEGCAAGEAVRS